MGQEAGDSILVIWIRLLAVTRPLGLSLTKQCVKVKIPVARARCPGRGALPSTGRDTPGQAQ